MQFAMYLVENGVISCEEFFEAVKLLLHSRPARMGFPTEAEVSNLLAEHAGREKRMVEVLVDYDFLSAELAEYHHAEYRRCVQLGQRELATAGR